MTSQLQALSDADDALALLARLLGNGSNVPEGGVANDKLCNVMGDLRQLVVDVYVALYSVCGSVVLLDCSLFEVSGVIVWGREFEFVVSCNRVHHECRIYYTVHPPVFCAYGGFYDINV